MVDDIIQEFLKEFKSKNTIRNYRISLRDYFQSISIQEPNIYFKSNRDYEKDIKTFCESMEKLAPKTFAMKISAIRTFFEEHKTRFPNHVVKKYKKRVIGSYVPITRDQVFTRKQLKEILADGDLRARAFFLTLASSGMRPGELMELKINDIDFKHDPAKITISRSKAKNKIERITFISVEAKGYLEQWINNKRDQYLKSYHKHIENFKEYKKGSKPSINTEKRVFPFTGANAWLMFQRLLERSGYKDTVITDNKGNERKAFHLHTFRKFARSNLPPEMPVDMVEQLLGHSGYLTDEYRKYDDNILAENYKKAMRNVTIFEVDDNLSEINEEMNQMKERMEKMENLLAQKETMLQMITNRLEIEKLKNGKK